MRQHAGEGASWPSGQYVSFLLKQEPGKSEAAASQIVRREATHIFGGSVGRAKKAARSPGWRGGGRKASPATSLLREKLAHDKAGEGLRGATFCTRWIVDQKGIKMGLKQARPTVYRVLRLAKEQPARATPASLGRRHQSPNVADAAPSGSNQMAVRIFVPTSCTQGGELACHATWKQEAIREIQVLLPPSVTLVSTFNAKKSKVVGGHAFRDFEVPGYLGLVFKAQVLPEARATLAVQVRVVSQDGRTMEQSFPVVVFRPLVEAVLAKGTKATDLTARLVARNLGFGTSIVKVVVAKDSTLSLEKPPGMKEFQDGFRADLTSRVPRLLELHPKHRELLDPLADILASELDIGDADRLQEIRAFFEALGEAMTEDQGLESDVVDAIIGALMNNTKGSTYFEKALEYLQSLATDNIILLNPLDTLVIPKGSHDAEIHLAVTDRSYNPYPVITLSGLKLSSPKIARIPVHALFVKERKA